MRRRKPRRRKGNKRRKARERRGGGRKRSSSQSVLLINVYIKRKYLTRESQHSGTTGSLSLASGYLVFGFISHFLRVFANQWISPLCCVIFILVVILIIDFGAVVIVCLDLLVIFIVVMVMAVSVIKVNGLLGITLMILTLFSSFSFRFLDLALHFWEIPISFFFFFLMYFFIDYHF